MAAAPSPALPDLVDLAERTVAAALSDANISLADRADLALRYLALDRGDRPAVPPTVTAPTGHATFEHIPYPSGDFNDALLPVRYHYLENFLTAADNALALSTALDQRDRFIGSSTTTNAADYRRSSVLYATFYPELFELLRRKILKQLPAATQALGIDPFLVSQLEMQMTAHNDGCFYKIHNDSGSPDTATRVLTYVYYFHQEPKAYDGGALRIYETDPLGDATLASEHYEDIVPANNSIILFESRYKHEVRPVICPSQRFEDGRFTLNGWLRRT